MRKKTLIKSKKIEEISDKGKVSYKEIIPGNFDESNPILMELYLKQHNHRVTRRKMAGESRKRNRDCS